MARSKGENVGFSAVSWLDEDSHNNREQPPKQGGARKKKNIRECHWSPRKYKLSLLKSIHVLSVKIEITQYLKLFSPPINPNTPSVGEGRGKTPLLPPS